MAAGYEASAKKSSTVVTVAKRLIALSAASCCSKVAVEQAHMLGAVPGVWVVLAEVLDVAAESGRRAGQRLWELPFSLQQVGEGRFCRASKRVVLGQAHRIARLPDRLDGPTQLIQAG